jgi:hypothetical protein
MRQQRMKRNEAKLAELGLLVPLAPRTKTNRRKCVAMQDDVVRWVQPKCNVKIRTSYKDIDEPVISKRTQPVSKRIRFIEDEAEYSPISSDYDDKNNEDVLESYNKDEDELERQGRRLSSRARKQTDYQGDCQYQSESFTRLKSN